MSYLIHVPSTLEEAYETRSRVCGQYLAGGTVALAIKKPSCDLVSLSRIPGLSYIKKAGECIEIGGGTTFDELDRSALVRERLSALWQASHDLAGPQIRNVATIAGNIGSMSPAADSVTALTALDADVRLFSVKDGKACRRTVSIRDMKIEEGEIIEAVSVRDDKDASVFEKVGKRNAMAVSVVNMAVSRVGKQISVAVGSAAPKVVFCPETSRILSGDGSAMTAAKAKILEEISPKDDRWGTVEQKRLVCANMLEKLVKEVLG